MHYEYAVLECECVLPLVSLLVRILVLTYEVPHINVSLSGENVLVFNVNRRPCLISDCLQIIITEISYCNILSVYALILYRFAFESGNGYSSNGAENFGKRLIL